MPDIARSSSDPPPVDLATLLTVPRLRGSHAGPTCPACGRTKAQKRALCGRCFRQLPEPVQKGLYRSVEFPDYQAALLQALWRLGARIFHENGTARIPVVRRAMVLCQRQLKASLDSTLCPKCRGPKRPGQSLCTVCRSILQTQYSSATQAGSRSRPRRTWRQFALDLDQAGFDHDAQAYAQCIFDSFRIMKTQWFFHPGERTEHP